MKYYKIDDNIDILYARQTGDLVGYDLDSPNAQGALSYYELPKFEPDFSKLFIPPIINGYTDILSDRGAIGGAGFIMTEKLKILFEEFNLGKGLHRFYPLHSYDCETGGSLPDIHYYYLQVIDIQINFDCINYPKSSFFLRKSDVDMDRKDIYINSLEDFNKIKENHKGHVVCYDKLVLTKNMEKDMDLFYFSRLADRYFSYIIISERLLGNLQKEGLDNLFKYKEVPISIESLTEKR